MFGAWGIFLEHYTSHEILRELLVLCMQLGFGGRKVHCKLIFGYFDNIFFFKNVLHFVFIFLKLVFVSLNMFLKLVFAFLKAKDM